MRCKVRVQKRKDLDVNNTNLQIYLIIRFSLLFGCEEIIVHGRYQ